MPAALTRPAGDMSRRLDRAPSMSIRWKNINAILSVGTSRKYNRNWMINFVGFMENNGIGINIVD